MAHAPRLRAAEGVATSTRSRHWTSGRTSACAEPVIGWERCASASLPARPAPCTSAAPAPRSTTGCWPAARAARSSCASRTPTASARRPRTSSRSSTRCAGWSSTGTRGRSARSRAPTATRRSSQRLLDDGHAYRSTATADDVKAFKARTAPTAASAASDEDEGAVRLRVPDEGATVVHDAHPRRDDLPARPHGRPGHRPRRRQRRSTTSRSPSTTSTPGSPTSSAARTTSPTRPSSCSCSRRSARSRRSTRTCRCCTAPTARSSPSATAPPRCRSCATAGYLPEAVRNYLALLGWGDDDDETFIPTDELVRRFRLERVSRNPAQFDEQKLRWMNGRYLRELGADELTRRLEAYLTGRTDELRDAVAIAQEKIQTLADFWPLAGFLFDGPADDAGAREQVARRRRARRARGRARRARRPRAASTPSAIEAALRGVVEARGGQAEGRLPAGARRARRHARSRRASSRRSRCSGATSRCAHRRRAGPEQSRGSVRAGLKPVRPADSGSLNGHGTRRAAEPIDVTSPTADRASCRARPAAGVQRATTRATAAV